MKTKITLLFTLLLVSFTMMAQYQVSGTVNDGDGQPLPGVSVAVTGSDVGTTTDFDGNYSLKVNKGDILEFTSVGFEPVTKTMDGSTTVDAVMSAGLSLDEIVLVGTRNPNRTATDTAVPIDVIDISEITSVSAQVSINDILNFVAPSFTSQTQTVSDGTDHVDPASLRGLGPDQVLVLINGKRRHNSSLINVNGTVGAGSVGTDLNSIPASAIKRIEVLRDGAAAQYGSDAIAGVINLVLNNSVNELNLTVTTGANFSENSNQFDGGSDGEKFQIDANYGLPLGKNGGYINFTGSLSTREPALRNKDYSGDIFKGYHGAERVFAANGGIVADMTLADYQNAAAGLSYLSAADQASIAGLNLADLTDLTGDVDSSGNVIPNGIPDSTDALRGLLSFDADEDELAARNLTREDFRFKVGTSKLREGKFFANLSIPLDDEKTEIYGFGGVSYRQGLASGFYRRPAQGDGRANTPAFPNGFLPNIGSDIQDKSFAFGIKGKLNEWNIDLSNTFGENTFDLTVGNSSNGTLGVATPRSFDAGGFGFSQNTTNLDLSRFYDDIFNGLNVAFGAEYKLENYSISAGEEASYTSYDINGNPVTSVTDPSLLVRNNFTGAVLGGGSQVYRGFDPGNATNKFRNSIAGYIDLEADLSEDFLISLAGRYEDFSDFGTTFNYKIAGRYKISDDFSIRAANSSGFRAPSLHQQFFSRTSTVFVDNVPFESGFFTNDSRAAKLINIPKLQEETSNSISFGLTGKVSNFTITVDAYKINIDDRIVLTGSFGSGTSAELAAIFNAAGATSARFFVNAIDTESQGIDLVVSHKMNIGTSMTLQNSFTATFSETEVTNINVPSLIADAGLSGDFFDGQEEAFLTIAQPGTKLNLTNTLNAGKWNFLLRNVFFGEVTDPDDFKGVARVNDRSANNDAVYGGKVVTDLSISTSVSDDMKFTIGANNLLDVYPDENRAGGTSGNQFVYSRRTSQFGYSGRFLFAKLTFLIK